MYFIVPFKNIVNEYVYLQLHCNQQLLKVRAGTVNSLNGIMIMEYLLISQEHYED